ncbi:hypothetical protein PF008_g7464 [Phytophthora fragariae]|uniref:Uncharacterized protein n=1 Tax=Phytophthora fragariae TaxID=53985 RepID=A0A6G0S446_9STRA|nr:hypothetical protein PF008_g7464 [Phytophthora fragariae]
MLLSLLSRAGWSQLVLQDVIPGLVSSSSAAKFHQELTRSPLKHQWFNYAENRKITDEGLTRDAEEMHKAGAHTKGFLAYRREQSGEFCMLPVWFL